MTDREPSVPVDEATRQRWAELALMVRMHEWIVANHAVPEPDTAFHAVDRMYPSEVISQWCREGIRSAIDHLRMWADHAVPLVQYEGQVVEHDGFRWTFTLMRAGLEGAAQSLFLSGSSSHQEAVARLVRMVRHDLGEQVLAWRAMGRDESKLVKRLGKHETAAATLGEFGKDTPKLPAMVDLVKMAAVNAERDPGIYEGHWRVCSAATHGKDWAIHELQTVVGEPVEWMPGQFHFKGHTDPERMTEMLSDTLDLISVASIRFLQRSHAGDINLVLKRASYEAAKTTPQKDGGEHLRRAARAKGLLDNET